MGQTDRKDDSLSFGIILSFAQNYPLLASDYGCLFLVAIGSSNCLQRLPTTTINLCQLLSAVVYRPFRTNPNQHSITPCCQMGRFTAPDHFNASTAYGGGSSFWAKARPPSVCCANTDCMTPAGGGFDTGIGQGKNRNSIKDISRQSGVFPNSKPY